MQIRDLSKAVLSIQPRCAESSRSLDIPNNQAFLTREDSEAPNRNDRDSTPHLIPPKIKITVQTDKIPRHPTRGWIFGSDPERCDYLLDTGKERGVSGTHFEICHNWKSRVVMIVNLSSNQLVMKVDDRFDIIDQGDKRALCQTDYNIEVGLLVFGLEIPDRGPFQSLYEENLENYRKTPKDAVPDIAALAVKRRGKDTPAVKGLLATSTTNFSDKYYRRWRIGAGSTGIVYNGVDKFSGREVALKDFRDRRTLSRILSEIEILRRVVHVHITRYIEVVENPDHLLVMEYVGGGSLADLKGVSRYETLVMAQQTSQALSYLHDQGITHRDIKPANILIVTRGRDFYCKIADFGESSEKSVLTTFCGTSLYEAPEITKPPYSKCVDIWSLGIIIVEFWYDWYPLCLDELSDTPRDSWLPDTQRENGPGVDTFQRDIFRGLDWTTSRKERWHRFIHRRLREENTKQRCAMAIILLQMLEIDPTKRFSASQCRYHLDSFHVAYELEAPREVQNHKRDATLAELDNPNATRRFLRNEEEVIIKPSLKDQQDTRPVILGKISEEPVEAVNPQIPSRSSEATSGVSKDDSSPKRRSERLGGRQKQIPERQAIQVIRLSPDSQEINATDILKATGRKSLIKWLLKITRRATRIGTYVTYKDGTALMRHLNMPETSTGAISQAMEQNQPTVSVPVTKTTITNQRKQIGGVVHLDPIRSIINATNLASAAGYHRTILSDLQKDFTFCTFVRAHGRQGTYVCYEDGLKLCDRFNLPKVLIKEAMDMGQDVVHIPAASSRSNTPRLGELAGQVKYKIEKSVQDSPTISVHHSRLGVVGNEGGSEPVQKELDQQNQVFSHTVPNKEDSRKRNDETGEDGQAVVKKNDFKRAISQTLEDSTKEEREPEDVSEKESEEESGGESEENETPDDDENFEYEAALNLDQAPPPRATLQDQEPLTEAGSLTPLQQFYPNYGPSSFYSVGSNNTSSSRSG